MSWFSKPLRWALGLAVAVIVGSACIADVQQPWMSLVVDGSELGDGQLVSYCWSSSIAVFCADGDRRDPQTYVIRSSHRVDIQVRTKPDMRELHVGVTDIDPRAVPPGAYTPPAPVDPARATPLTLGVGIHYISVIARWERGNGYFLFALRVEPQ